MTTERTIELGDDGPREVSMIRQLDSRAYLDALASDACRGQSSRPHDERCDWIGSGDLGRIYALGPRGVLVILDVDPDALRPTSGEVFEVPYRALAGHVVPGSALARYLERCPAALEP